MSHRKTIWLGGLIAGLGITAVAWAQAPGIPGVPVAPAAPAAGNLWSFLLPNADQKLACKTHFCDSALGKLVSGFSGPLGAATGGLMGGRCAKNALQNDLLNKSADDPNGLAARVKADEEAAKARRQAVRFLGTVDCNYWPEAIDTLKTALRKDRNECVRYEAALALRNGCCCNNEIIDALKNSVLGENRTDPNPIERSDRVRAAAADALARCPLAAEPKQDEKLLTSNPSPNLDPAEYYKKIAQMPRDQVAASARAVLTSMQKGDKLPAAGTEAASLPAVAPIPPRPGNVSDIMANAFAPAFTTSGPRQPFFAGLTKALTGNQDTPISIRQEVLVPAHPEIIPLREIKPVAPIEAPRPYPLRNPTTTAPRVNIPITNMVTPVPVVEPISPVAHSEAAPLTIKLIGPTQTTLGSPAVFDVRVTNQTSQPLRSIELYGWLSDCLSHAAGQEIKGEVNMAIPPGETRTLRLPTQSVKTGRGSIQVKVATSAGEAFAKQEIEVVGLLQSVASSGPTLSFTNKESELPHLAPARRPAMSLEIIQTGGSGAPSAPQSSGTVGMVTMEEVSPVPSYVTPRR